MGFTGGGGVGSSVDITEIEGASLVTESETIASNDNDTTVPTSAAVKDYVDNGTATLASKTLTAPKIANGGFVADANGNELIIFTTTASAVNEITFANGATTVNPKFTASGETNVGIDFQAKGTGTYRFLGTASQAAEIRLFEDTDNGTNYSAFRVGTQSADLTYTLPTALGAAGAALTDTAGDGILAWTVPAGFSYGSSISGTTANGCTITLSNSSNDAAGALKLIAGNTQANQVVLANLQIGTSGNAMGLLIQGTGSTTIGDGGAGESAVHLQLWGNTAANVNKVLSVGDGATYDENFYLTAGGCIHLTPEVHGSGIGVLDVDLQTIGASQKFITTNNNNTPNTYNGIFTDFLVQTNGNSLTNRTNDVNLFAITRTESRTSGTTADNFILSSITRTQTTTGAGGTLTAAGTVQTLTNSSTQTAGTLTDTVIVQKLVQDSLSTGDIEQWVVDSTVKGAFTASGNLCLGVGTAGADAANGVLCLSNGATAPSDSTDRVQLYAFDISAGNASLGIRTETAVVSESVVSDRTLTIAINGTQYKVCLKV